MWLNVIQFSNARMGVSQVHVRGAMYIYICMSDLVLCVCHFPMSHNSKERHTSLSTVVGLN